MIKYRNLILIGTSHIAKQSMDEVKLAIETEKPNLVALELDKKRLTALLSKNKEKQKVSVYNIRRIGFKAFFFTLIASWIQQKLGKHVGIMPGSEMKTAIRLAKKNKIKVALIDQDIEITLKKFSKSLTWKEKWNFVVDLFNGFVLRKKQVENFDLTKVPEKKLIKKMVGIVKKRYPNIYKVLVEDRNKIMSKNLIMLMKKHPEEKILAVVGAGHEDDMIKIIKDKINKIDISYTVSFG